MTVARVTILEKGVVFIVYVDSTSSSLYHCGSVYAQPHVPFVPLRLKKLSIFINSAKMKKFDGC